LQQANTPLDSDHLKHCYQAHQLAVHGYFSDRDDLLTLNISKPNSLDRLLKFIGITATDMKAFPKLNVGTRVSSWKSLKHPNKINSYSAGKEHRKFFDYL